MVPKSQYELFLAFQKNMLSFAFALLTILFAKHDLVSASVVPQIPLGHAQYTTETYNSHSISHFYEPLTKYEASSPT